MSTAFKEYVRLMAALYKLRAEQDCDEDTESHYLDKMDALWNKMNKREKEDAFSAFLKLRSEK